MAHNSLRRIIVAEHTTIQEVIAALSAPRNSADGLPGGLALVCGKSGVLLGIATDGDLRRGLSRGVQLSDPVSKIINKNPIVIPDSVPYGERAAYIRNALIRKGSLKKYVEKAVVVDEKNHPMDVLTTYDIWQTADARQKRVGVIGLGYVGLTLSLVLADLGFTVFGLEKDARKVRELKSGKPYFHENGLAELLQKHIGGNFKLVNDFSGANFADVYVVAVGTPIDTNGVPDYSALQEVAQYLGTVIKRNDLVLLRSTVAIGTTREVVVPLLEKESGLSAGSEFLVAFAPERTVEGKAIEELRLLPQVVGGLNHSSSEAAAAVFSFLTRSIVTLDSLEEAEMVKLINNTYRDVSFGFANEVALIAEKWNINGSKVIQAANFGYERSAVPRPSPGVGGYCLSKDPQIFKASAEKKGYTPKILCAGRSVNENMIKHIADEAASFLRAQKVSPKNATALILGFAFKGVPKTADVRGAMAIELAEALKKRGIKNILGFDPAVPKADIEKSSARAVADISVAFKKADIVAVMNNNPDFSRLDIKKLLRGRKKQMLVFDGWNMFKEQELSVLPHVLYKNL